MMSERMFQQCLKSKNVYVTCLLYEVRKLNVLRLHHVFPSVCMFHLRKYCTNFLTCTDDMHYICRESSLWPVAVGCEELEQKL